MNLSTIDLENISPIIYRINQDSFNIENHIFNYKSYKKLYFDMLQQNSLISIITSNIS